MEVKPLRVLLLPKYHRDGASSRYRYYNYFEWLQQAPLSITCKPLLYFGYVSDLYNRRNRLKRTVMAIVGICQRIRYLLLNKNNFDLILIEKELVTFMPLFIEKFLLGNSRYLVDYDDNIHARYQQGLARLFLSTKIPSLAAQASAVTIGNKWYFSLFRHCSTTQIHYLPTVINRTLYLPWQKDYSARTVPVIVWIGSPSTAHYLAAIDHVLQRLQAVIPFRLLIIGARPRINTSATYITWQEETEIEQITSADIGIMPLGSADWDQGKCGLKLIQYFACGLPVVASPTVANEAIVDSQSGFIAGSGEEWYYRLLELLQSPELRRAMGIHARERAFSMYSYQVWAPVFIKLLLSLRDDNSTLKHVAVST